MKKPTIFLIGTLFFCILIPVLISALFYGKDKVSDADVKTQKLEKNAYETVDSRSPSISVYNSKTGKIQTMDMETFLYGVVSMEMSSEFSEEALKAQAVAARTYIIYKIQNKINDGHKGADICTDCTHCQAYASYDEIKSQKGDKWIQESYPIIKQAVDDTKGQILTYDDKAILPLYFSTSSGMTENSEDVFKSQYPYLKSVSSPYEKNSPKYYTESTIDKNDFINLLKNKYADIIISKKNLQNEIAVINRTTAGSVKNIKIGNKQLSGRDVRSVFGLNSSNFDISCDDDTVTFKVKGYGHGVGMSLWGAEGMAKKNYKYDQILFHYYTGTEIKDIY